MSCRRRWTRIAGAMAAVAVAVSAWACERPGGGGGGGQGTTARQSAAPHRVVPPDSIDATTRARIEAQIKTAAFDAVTGAADERPLTVGVCPDCGPGPRARIEPETTSYRIPIDSVYAGRIVARMVNLDKTQGYRKYGLPPGGTVYWYVDRGPNGLRSILYPDPAAGGTPSVVVDTLIIDDHRGAKHFWKQSLARWIYSDTDDGGWAVCTETGCCRVGVAQ